MNTIKELTQQEKYNTMLKRKNREIKSLKEQLELLVKDDEKYQETIIRQSKIINKAIKYIEKYHFIDGIRVMDMKEYKELYNILKGGEE